MARALPRLLPLRGSLQAGILSFNRDSEQARTGIIRVEEETTLPSNNENRRAVPIEFQKMMMDSVNINLPGPAEPTPSMSGGELMHGFLAELHDNANPDVRAFVDGLCVRWNVRFQPGK